jgi:hypothetical protein
MTDFRALITLLASSRIEFIIIGGAAATAHGSARLTSDLDIVYRRTSENISRLVSALAPYAPYLRGAPPGLPFNWSEKTVQNGLNFTLITTIGALDLFGEIIAGGGYDDLISSSIKLELYGVECLCLAVECLIAVKRATGRPKDLEVVAELEAILEERSQR